MRVFDVIYWQVPSHTTPLARFGHEVPTVAENAAICTAGADLALRCILNVP